MSTTGSDKEARNAEKEVKAVSKLVSRKLEGYMNYARREQRFDPSGRGHYRTNLQMHKYDMMYKMLEMTEMEAAHRKKVKAAEKKENKEKKLAISPRLETTSRRVTLNHEAERLTKNANTVFESTPVDKLNKIHRYRPHSGNTEHNTENGKVMNYTRHVGAALHSETYVQYYQKEGLETGSKKKSPRLQKLKPKPKDTDKKSPRGSEQGDGDTKEKETKPEERYAPEKAAHYIVQNRKPICLDEKEEDKDKRTKKWVKERQTNDKDPNENEANNMDKDSDNKVCAADEEQLDTASVISNTSHKSNQSKCSNHSNKSNESHCSNRSKASASSNRSKDSHHSNRSKASTHSNRSKASNQSNKSNNSQHSTKSKESHQRMSYHSNLTADRDNNNEDESTDVQKSVDDKADKNNQKEHKEEDSQKAEDNNINNENLDNEAKEEKRDNQVEDNNNPNSIDSNGNKSGDINSNDSTSDHYYSDDNNADDNTPEDNVTDHNNPGDKATKDKKAKKQRSEDTHSTSSTSEIYSSVEHIDRRANMFI